MDPIPFPSLSPSSSSNAVNTLPSNAVNTLINKPEYTLMSKPENTLINKPENTLTHDAFLHDDEIYDVVIAGGGATGLLAGLLAYRAGLRTLILEKRSEPRHHSRSIGIHPPSLRLLKSVGLLEQFVTGGIVIRKGIASSGFGKILGYLDFRELPGDCPFILALPQWQTEALLEDELRRHDRNMVRRGCTLTDFQQIEDPEGDFSSGVVSLTAQSVQGPSFSLKTRLLLACDGKNSFIREQLGIRFRGRAYQNRYAMGDFTDDTAFGNDAVIFLHPEGMVECFPLPGGLRRWVVQQPDGPPLSDPAGLVRVISQRCGLKPERDENRMFSAFGVERYLADACWRNRILLAGDAAHIVSPIGGQGMNLGWLDAADAIKIITDFRKGKIKRDQAADRYNQTVRKRARKAISRAEFNMKLGGASRMSGWRNLVVRGLLATPLRHRLLLRFTMHGLPGTEKTGFLKQAGQ